MCLLNKEASVFCFFYSGIQSVITVHTGDVYYLIKIQEKCKGCRWDHQSAGRVSPTCLQTAVQMLFCFPQRRNKEEKERKKTRGEEKDMSETDK